MQFIKNKNYRRLQQKAHDLVTKQLDLVTSVRKSRKLAFSLISLLSLEQRNLVRKLGDSFTTHDDSEFESDSD